MPKLINKSDVLERVMQVFWRKGYTDTSYDDLVKESGISRHGLYSTFGDKHALFLAALDHYRDSAPSVLLRPVEQQNASIPEIRQVFDHMLADYRDSAMAGLGCFIFNTGLELAPGDDQASQKVKAQLLRYQRAFRHALENAKAEGELSPETDTEVLADYLTGVVQASAALDRMKASLAMIENYMGQALVVLN